MERSTKAAILSLLIVGLGQLYLGHLLRAATWFIGGIVIAILTGLIGAPIVWIASAWDAHNLAKKEELQPSN